GIADQSLLRSGVTFSARWRVDPNAPPYMDTPPTGNGEPLAGGALGNIGFYFLNKNGELAGAGPTAALSLGLNSPDLLLLSVDNGAGAASQLPMAGVTV